MQKKKKMQWRDRVQEEGGCSSEYGEAWIVGLETMTDVYFSTW